VNDAAGNSVTDTKINVASAADINTYARIMVDGIEVNAAVASKSMNGGVATKATSVANVRQAQVDTITLASTGALSVGETVTLKVNDVDLTYTLTAADVSGGTSTLASNIAAAYNASANPAHTPITASTNGSVITLTADSAGDVFTATVTETMANGSAARAAYYGDNADIESFTVSGTFSNSTSADTLSAVINGTTYTYTAAADPTTADEMAAGLVDAINTAGIYTASSSGGVITVGAKTANGALTVTTSVSANSSGGAGASQAVTASTQSKPVAQVDTITISGNYAVGDVITMNVNGVDLNYTVTSSDIQTEGNVAADFTRIAASIANAFNLSTSSAHTPITATSSGAVITLTADIAGNSFSAGTTVSGAGAVVLDTAITIKNGQKIEFFNPVTTMPAASSSPAGSATVNITANSSIEKDQFVYKLDSLGKVVRVVDSTGNAIRVSGVSGTTLTLSGVPSVALTNDTLLFYNPVAYRLTLQDGSNVSMSGDLFTGQANQKFTATTTKYEVYGALDGNFYNSGNNLFSGNVSLPAPVGDGAYRPIADLQFWGGKNIDAVVTNPVTGLPTFQSQVTLSGKVTTPGNTPQSLDPDLVFSVDLTGTKNFATPFGVDESTQDGRSVALLNSVSIDKEGKIVGTYGDGRNFIAGQLVLVNFAATNGLMPTGGNAFQATYMSGDEVNPNVLVGKPGEKGLGGIKAGAVEGSNVDLANELVKLLIQQRMYAANSQSIKAFDDTLTTTIRMAGG